MFRVIHSDSILFVTPHNRSGQVLKSLQGFQCIFLFFFPSFLKNCLTCRKLVNLLLVQTSFPNQIWKTPRKKTIFHRTNCVCSRWKGSMKIFPAFVALCFECFAKRIQHKGTVFEQIPSPKFKHNSHHSMLRQRFLRLRTGQQSYWSLKLESVGDQQRIRIWSHRHFLGPET